MVEPLVYVLNFLDHVLLLVKLAFFYLGLFDPTGLAPSVDNHMDRVAVMKIAWLHHRHRSLTI